MSTHKHMDKLCLVAAIVSVLLTGLLANGKAFGIQEMSNGMGYETRLFDTAKVHTIEIVMDDWDSFIETCENEEYAVCSVIIDGEAYKNVGIRAKGNTSLSTVSSQGSDRYSFKIEFDQYDSTKSYYGLDKLSLNNVIQDDTYMKDYLTYQMMGQFGAAAPLCSYVYITVNGEDWGLYLAVESIEDSFLQRNYGSDYGELYKPDAMNFGGGRGNGKEFNMDDFMRERDGESSAAEVSTGNMEIPAVPEGVDPAVLFENGVPGDIDTAGFPDWRNRASVADAAENRPTDAAQIPPGPNAKDGFAGEFDGFGGGMGSSDVKLQYIDDDPDSYSNIFSSAKTDITQADQTRLIQALKSLSEGEDLEDAVNVDAVIKYFVVHNFVCNGDSYTGNMIHNYYLYEENGQLSMLPWDYNLAYGTFQSSNATQTVNTPIDTPVSGGIGEDRPMIRWIFSREEYTELYHQYFTEFLEETDFAALIDETAARIAPYVEKDPSKFCTYEDFQAGVATLREFCLLREESVMGQLNGTIPSTTQGQNADASSLIDASHITISDMGSMGMGGGGRGGKAAFGGMPMPEERTERPEMGETMQLPDENGTDFFVPGNRGDVPNAGDSNGTQVSAEAVQLLGVSLLVLLAGLAAAFKFKR